MAQFQLKFVNKFAWNNLHQILGLIKKFKKSEVRFG